MEERQRQIREGAGLEESRLNVEFIDFLRKYSTPILVVIAVVAGGYAGYRYLHQQRDLARDKAFVELDSAVAARSVVSLSGVAEDHAGSGAVALLARLNEADLRLESYRSGLRPGTALIHDPVTNQYRLPNDEKYLTDEERAEHLTKAGSLYQAVADQTAREPERVLLRIGALNGLASVAECRSELDSARNHYRTIVEAAKTAGFDALAAAAQKRLDTLDSLGKPRLYAMAELPNAAAPPARQPGAIQALTPEGTTLTLQKDPENPAKLVPIQIDPQTGEPIKEPGSSTPLPRPEETPPTPAPNP